MNDHSAIRASAGRLQSRLAWLLFCSLLFLIALLAIAYPQLASWIYESATGRGWDGSGLRYFQLFRVLPATAVGLAALTGFGLWCAFKGRPLSIKAVAFAWITVLVALAFSIAWYASQMP